MNAKVIVALTGVRDNLDILIKAISEGEDAPEVAVSKVEAKSNVIEMKTKKSAVAEKETADSSVEYTKEYLDSLTYNNLKKLAKEKGISAIGNRDDITDRFLEGDSTTSKKTSDPAPAAKTKTPMKNKPNTKVPSKLEEVVEDESGESEEVDNVEVQVNEAVAEMSNEDIAELLTSIGVSAAGKRQALISKVVDAVKKGDISLDDDEESEDADGDETSETSEDSTEESEDETNEEDDSSEFDDPDLMTDARREAIESFVDSARADFKAKKLNRKDIVDFLQGYNNTKDTYKDSTDKDLLEEYLYCSARLIDDEGNFASEDAYMVSETPFCCGEPLKYVEDTKSYICEKCGAEYQAE